MYPISNIPNLLIIKQKRTTTTIDLVVRSYIQSKESKEMSSEWPLAPFLPSPSPPHGTLKQATINKIKQS